MSGLCRRVAALLLAAALCVVPVGAWAAGVGAGAPGDETTKGQEIPGSPEGNPSGEDGESPILRDGEEPGDDAGAAEGGANGGAAGAGPEGAADEEPGDDAPPDEDPDEAPVALRSPAAAPVATIPAIDLGSLASNDTTSSTDWHTDWYTLYLTTEDGVYRLGGDATDPQAVHFVRVDPAVQRVTIVLDGAAVGGLDCGDAAVALWLEGANRTTQRGVTVDAAASLDIRGNGKLDAVATSSGYAGIGGNNGDAGVVVIHSGTVTATGGGSAAGIGGGAGGDATTIAITGGRVTATSGDGAAGIGGGYQGGAGTIAISGGRVDAVGGGAASTGIGSGRSGSGGCVEIRDSLVEARGIGNCAGLGGTDVDVTITRSTVTAASMPYGSHFGGAGIGGELLPSGGTDAGALEIVDSVVTATSHHGGAGIGGSAMGGQGGAVYIRGNSTVRVTGGDYNATYEHAGDGIQATSLTIDLTGGGVYATGGMTGETAFRAGDGIAATGAVDIALAGAAVLEARGGACTAAGGDAGRGVVAADLPVRLAGGSLRATGGEADGVGVLLSGDLTLSGYGSLVATGGSGGYGLHAAGVYADDFAVTGVPGPAADQTRVVRYDRAGPRSSGGSGGAGSERVALAVSGWPQRVAVGEAFTLTANVGGGEWRFDGALLAAAYPDDTFLRNPATFTGLAPGVVTVTYTVGEQSVQGEVEIVDAAVAAAPETVVNDNPSTGGGLRVGAVWLALAAAAGGLAMSRKRE